MPATRWATLQVQALPSTSGGSLSIGDIGLCILKSRSASISFERCFCSLRMRRASIHGACLEVPRARTLLPTVHLRVHDCVNAVRQ